MNGSTILMLLDGVVRGSVTDTNIAGLPLGDLP